MTSTENFPAAYSTPQAKAAPSAPAHSKTVWLRIAHPASLSGFVFSVDDERVEVGREGTEVDAGNASDIIEAAVRVGVQIEEFTPSSGAAATVYNAESGEVETPNSEG